MWYAQPFYHSLSPTWQTVAKFFLGDWPLMIFFAGAAYSDATSSPSFGTSFNERDALMLGLLWTIPFSAHFLGRDNHAARWFFIFNHMPTWNWKLAADWLGMNNNDEPLEKLAGSTITYVLVLLWAPRAVEWLACRGPYSVAKEKRYGALLWLVVILLSLLSILGYLPTDWACLSVDPFSTGVQTCPHLSMQKSTWHKFRWRMLLPLDLSMNLARIGVLAAALAYLPFTALPAVALNSPLGALLLMPLTM